MDQELDWIFLTGIEIWRLHNEAFNLSVIRALEPEWLERLHGHLREYGIVEMSHRSRPLARRNCGLVDFIGRLGRHPREKKCLAIFRKCKIVIVPPDNLRWCAAIQWKHINGRLPLILRTEIDRR